MKRSYLPILVVFSLLVLAGCSTGGSSAASKQGQGFGRATFAIKWPADTRLVPAACKSIRVVVRQGTTTIKAQILPRPIAGVTDTLVFSPLPVGALMATATAYANTQGTGTPQATATIPLIIEAGKDTPFTLTMASTIASVSVSPNPFNLAPGAVTTLIPTAIDATGAVVLTSPSKAAWVSANQGVARVDTAGKATGVAAGSTTITYTDTESGKSGSTTVTVREAGTPAFAAPVSYNVPIATDLVAAGDLDGDGNPDVAIAPFTELGILYGRGDGTLEPYTAAQTGYTGARLRDIADVDKDGLLDVVIMDMSTNQLVIAFNQGGRKFAPAVKVDIGDLPSDVFVGDLNGDGLPDIGIPFWSGAFKVYRNNGNRTFTQVASGNHSGIVEGFVGADINGDHIADLFISYEGAGAGGQIYYGNADGTYRTGETYNIGNGNMTSPRFADLNGDGVLDLVLNHYWNHSIAVFINKGNGIFNPATEYGNGPYPLITRLADINSDGILDIVTANAGSDHVSVLIGRSGGTFAPAQTFASGGTDCRSCWVVDLNKDGKPDIITQNLSNNTVGVLLNNTP